jgi:hypothetical protein
MRGCDHFLCRGMGCLSFGLVFIVVHLILQCGNALDDSEPGPFFLVQFCLFSLCRLLRICSCIIRRITCDILFFSASGRTTRGSGFPFRHPFELLLCEKIGGPAQMLVPSERIERHWSPSLCLCKHKCHQQRIIGGSQIGDAKPLSFLHVGIEVSNIQHRQSPRHIRSCN